ncbi:hypothetical protein cypCar_00045794 [Cyprinus carpio]|nr:hypothetical protein cypCar_00045794 [Cyprinus carpio]
MQHAASSEELSSSSGELGDAHRRSSALEGGVTHVSHSFSMFLPSEAQRASANGKIGAKIMFFCVTFRKNWNPSWVVLVGNSLVFFKDPKSQNPDSWDKENPLDNVLQYSLRRAGSVEMLDQSGDEDENRGGNKTSMPRSASNLENSEHKRVKSRLKKLILRRPPLQTLQEKGLIKDQVFGCGLELLCEREKSTIPQFVRKCTDAVERKGLETDGIYRVSGNLAVIQKLRFAVNHGEKESKSHQYHTHNRHEMRISHSLQLKAT